MRPFVMLFKSELLFGAKHTILLKMIELGTYDVRFLSNRFAQNVTKKNLSDYQELRTTSLENFQGRKLRGGIHPTLKTI